MKMKPLKYIAYSVIVIASVITFLAFNGLFYFFGAYGFGGMHFECGNIDFRLSYDNYSAIINGEYLPKKNWRLINDDDVKVNKHYWVGSTHTYATIATTEPFSIVYYADGQKCEKFNE